MNDLFEAYLILGLIIYLIYIMIFVRKDKDHYYYFRDPLEHIELEDEEEEEEDEDWDTMIKQLEVIINYVPIASFIISGIFVTFFWAFMLLGLIYLYFKKE